MTLTAGSQPECVAKTVSDAIAEINVEPTDTLEHKVRFFRLRQRGGPVEGKPATGGRC